VSKSDDLRRATDREICRQEADGQRQWPDKVRSLRWKNTSGSGVRADREVGGDGDKKIIGKQRERWSQIVGSEEWIEEGAFDQSLEE
jgi:hypothetical protein